MIISQLYYANELIDYNYSEENNLRTSGRMT